MLVAWHSNAWRCHAIAHLPVGRMQLWVLPEGRTTMLVAWGSKAWRCHAAARLPVGRLQLWVLPVGRTAMLVAWASELAGGQVVAVRCM